MRLLPCFAFAFFALVLSGCGSLPTYAPGRIDGARVSNPTLGRGVSYEIPSTYSRLTPQSPAPVKSENIGFERYLRGIVAANDNTKTSHAFQETYLFRGPDRYLVIFHVAFIFPGTFQTMPPARFTKILPQVAHGSYRYFDAPPQDFDYTFEEKNERSLIAYKPFRLKAAGAGQGWRGIGCTIFGDATDIIDIRLFAREQDIETAKADLQFILDQFAYGKPANP